jgi:hypothetical protein
MTAPNMINTATVTGRSTYFNLQATSSNVVVNNINSSTLVKINHLMLANYNTSTVTGTVVVYRASNTTGYNLITNISVPSGTTVVILGKDTPVYMEEGDQLMGYASTGNSICAVTSYEIIS